MNPPPAGLARGSTNSFRLFVDGRIKSGKGVLESEFVERNQHQPAGPAEGGAVRPADGVDRFLDTVGQRRRQRGRRKALARGLPPAQLWRGGVWAPRAIGE